MREMKETKSIKAGERTQDRNLDVKLIRDSFVECVSEIRRLNQAAAHTVFNPAVLELVGEALVEIDRVSESARTEEALATGTAEVDSTLRDPAASDWLKSALRVALSRDIVDATHDAARLAAILERRCRFVLKAARDGSRTINSNGGRA